MKKPLTISLVIPVYNEESHLAACLRAALKQKQPFLEIIVIDNNSTDSTADIAANFPGVTLLHETRQGVVFARNRGFSAAHGDIIARIDGDTILPTDWTRQLGQIFTDDTVDAVSGKMEYYDMAAPRLFNRVDLFFRRHFARVLGREVALQGANMALRRTVWQNVQRATCVEGHLHEDFDLAIHTNQAGYEVRFDERLVAAIGYRQGATSFRSFCTYAYLSPKTYLRHGLKSGRRMYPTMVLAITCFVILKVLHRGYDPVTERFSLQRVFLAPEAVRVNPALFVD